MYPDFKELLALLNKHKVKYLVIGGYAVIHHSRPRYTGDLDVWVEASEANAERIVMVLQDFGFPPQAVSIAMITEQQKIIRMGFEPMRLELFTKIPGVEFSDCYPRHQIVKIGRLNVPFIGLSDLKRNKQASGRPKDLQDLEELP